MSGLLSKASAAEETTQQEPAEQESKVEAGVLAQSSDGPDISSILSSIGWAVIVVGGLPPHPPQPRHTHKNTLIYVNIRRKSRKTRLTWPKNAPKQPATHPQLTRNSAATQLSCKTCLSSLFDAVSCTELRPSCAPQLTATQALPTFQEPRRTRATQRNSLQLTPPKNHRKNDAELQPKWRVRPGQRAGGTDSAIFLKLKAYLFSHCLNAALSL